MKPASQKETDDVINQLLNIYVPLDNEQDDMMYPWHLLRIKHNHNHLKSHHLLLLQEAMYPMMTRNQWYSPEYWAWQ